jgi:hypothetical protein
MDTSSSCGYLNQLEGLHAIRMDTTRQTLKNRVQGKQDFIVRWLQDFYNQPGRLEEVLPILSGTSPVSLRLIDWFVTNYSKKFNVSYLLDERQADGILQSRQFMVHFQYKRELKAYSKRLFDPFCRRERIAFQIRGQPPIEETTVGQLNFFRWALEKGVVRYILDHAGDIERDMNVSFREHYSKEPEAKSSTGRRKRKEMSKSAMKAVNFHEVPVVVSFD